MKIEKREIKLATLINSAEYFNGWEGKVFIIAVFALLFDPGWERDSFISLTERA